MAKKLKIKRAPLDGSTEPEEIAAQPLFEAIARQTWVRNLSAHHSPIGAEVADADIKRFGQAVLTLAEALLCQSCGGVPQRRKESYWVCPCGRTQMIPLALS